MATPIYVSRVAPPAARLDTLRPAAPLPDDGSQLAARAVAQAGNQLFGIAEQVQAATDEAAVVRAKTAFAERQPELENGYLNAPDQDWTTAPDRFRQDAERVKQEVLAGVPDHLRPRVNLEMTERLRIATGRIEKRALEWQFSSAQAGLDQQAPQLLNQAVTAGSPAERVTFQRQHDEQVDALAARGVLAPDEAARRKARFAAGLDEGVAVQDLQRDPNGTRAALQDPARYPGIPADRRLALQQAAAARADEIAAGRIRTIVQFDPVRALGLTGRVGSPADGDRLMAALVGAESGGDPGAVSRKGAVGLAQLMPPTAREMARKLGRADVAALDDGALVERLKDDQALNLALGRAYLQEGLARYDGNIWAAFARYNAGPGNDQLPRGDAWHAEAERRFGPSYTAGQLASVITIPETRAYVLDVARRLGVDPDAPGLSVAAQFRVAASNAAELEQRGRQDGALAARLAAVAADDSQLIEALKLGAPVDAGALAAQRQLLATAAAGGGIEAVRRLRDFDTAVELAPVRREAMGLPPAALDQAVALERQAVMGGGGNPRRLQVLEAVRGEVAQQSKADPVGLVYSAGIARPAAIDPQAEFASADMQQALAARGAHAALAAQRYGAPLMPFRPSEEVALRQRWGDATPLQRGDMLASLTRAMPSRPLVEAAVRQLGGSDYARAAAMLAPERPDLARKVLQGEALLAQKANEPGKEDLRAALKSTLGGRMYPDARQTEQVIDAALALYAAERGATGALYDTTNRGRLEEAIQQVTGPIETINGRRTPLPPSLPQGLVGLALRNLTREDLDAAGGAIDAAGRPFDPAWLRGHLQLLPTRVGSTVYAVVLGEGDAARPVMTAGGGPLALDLADLVKAYQRRRDAAAGRVAPLGAR